VLLKIGDLRGMTVASNRLEISDVVVAGVDSDAANSVMDLIRREFVKGGNTDSTKDIKLVKAEEFEYVHQCCWSCAFVCFACLTQL
jgi:hypothetical protein